MRMFPSFDEPADDERINRNDGKKPHKRDADNPANVNADNEGTKKNPEEDLSLYEIQRHDRSFLKKRTN